MIAFNLIEKSIMSREYLVFKTGELWNCSPEGNGKDCRSGDSFIPNVAELFPGHEECSHPPFPSPGYHST
ncbi:predicted protein [Methanosarcina acetivorans C2A]|uniref:Uncharacterized protein n=1 Tax=Methanosarcina acetivorans (strain ATCC 35395 / DSM 2834 / JCM 12185 / C2A) TaxID=188937 RepID=Q8THK6_METAC|nr:predicted protein [Methanosarcina acetivorans C2A]